MTKAPPGRPQLLALGDLGRTSLVDVLAMISASRQTLGLVVRERDQVVGRIAVKAGMVCEALARPDRRGRDALRVIRSARLTSFELYRLDRVVGEPLGELAELWNGLPETAPANPSLFRGRFEHVSLSDLLAVMSVSRQTLGVMFWKAGLPRGSWVTKAGQILGAEVSSEPDLDVRTAFARLMADPGDSFTVVEMLEAAGAEAAGSFFTLAPAPGSQPARRPARQLVRSGAAEAEPFGSLLVGFAPANQPIRLFLRQGGLPLGEVAVHNGNVLWARTVNGLEGREGFAELARSYVGRETTFELYRSDDRPAEILGSVVDLLADLDRRGGAGASAPEPEGPRRLFGASFSRISLDDLVAMMSVSRRRLGVVLFRGRKPIGGWVVKSGQILDATVLGQSLPPQRAFETLREDPGSRFVVLEYSQPLEAERRVGEFGALWSGRGAQEPSSDETAAPTMRQTAPGDEEIVRGNLAETPLFVVLMSLGLSRQHLAIELYVGDVLLGTIDLRSSQVLDVRHSSGVRGPEAMFRLLTAAVADRFRILRRANANPAAYVPLGSLDRVLRGLRTALVESGPRLVVPGEEQLMAWLDSEPPPLESHEAELYEAIGDDELPTDLPGRSDLDPGVRDLTKRVSALQLIVVLQAGMLVVLLLVVLVVLAGLS